MKQDTKRHFQVWFSPIPNYRFFITCNGGGWLATKTEAKENYQKHIANGRAAFMIDINEVKHFSEYVKILTDCQEWRLGTDNYTKCYI